MNKRWVIGITIFAMLASPVLNSKPVNVYAATSSSVSSSVVKNLAPIKLNSTTTLKYSKVNLIQAEKSNILLFTIAITNTGSKDLNLIDYWYKVKSKSGASFKLQKFNPEAEEIVRANSTVEFTFYAEVGKITNLAELVIEVIEWDLYAPNYERRIGTTNLNVAPQEVTAFKDTSTKRYNGFLLYTRLAKAVSEKGTARNTVTIDWAIVNASNQSFKLEKTRFILVTASGVEYPVTLEEENVTVLARETKWLKLKVEVPINVNLNGSKMVWQEEVEKITAYLPIAQYGVQVTTPTNEEKPVVTADVLKLVFEEQSVEFSPVEFLKVTKNETLNTLQLKYKLLNTGKKAVQVPNIELEYKAPSGAVYPLTKVEAEGGSSTLNPGVARELELKGEIPVQQSTGTGTLMIYEVTTVDGKEQRKALGNHKIGLSVKPVEEQKITAFGSQASYTNTSGKYSLSINNFVRTPWDNNDLLQAVLKVKNVDTEHAKLPLLNVKAELYLDGVKLDKEIQFVKTFSEIGIDRNKEVSFILNTELDYKQTYDRLKVVLTEQVEDKTVTVGVFEGKPRATTLNTFKYGQSINSIRTDKSNELVVRDTRRYFGARTDLLQVNLEIRNKGLRVDTLGKYVAYFRNKSGVVYPATILETNERISPQGRVVTVAQAVVPQNINTDDFELLIGEGITSEGYANAGDTATAYVNASIVELSKPSGTIPSEIKQLNVYPYEFSMSNVLASVMDERRFSLNFDYDLKVNTGAEVDLTKHSLLIEMLDDKGKKYEFTAVIEDENGEGLSFGTNIRFEKVFDDSNLFTNVPLFKGYTINIYDVVDKNYKRLVGSQKFEWMIRS